MRLTHWAVLVVFLGSHAAAQAPASRHSTLMGRSGQLVRFQGGDGTTLTPDDGSKYRSPVVVRGPVTLLCGGTATLRATFYKTQPAMVLLERGGAVIPAFQVRAASGSRYEGDGVLFWEARGEVTLDWMGIRSICDPN